ncbi:phenylacetaldoxime dehydratase family protein [Pseudomonas sp. KCJK8993]|uniref:phenylacetaldoxime dehydratase family protein n=1 Tax=Pseudomonas sp. KCJK8993 TaxID=3344565 RepID=UPI0039066980
MSIESAIPKHLVCPRLEAASTPHDYQAPFPAWTARFTPLVERVVMACFGAQAPGPLGLESLAPYIERFALANGPLYWDPAQCQDATGTHNLVAIAYWADVAAFERWRCDSGFDQWWQAPERETEATGRFVEIVTPGQEWFETLFSSPDGVEGIAHLGSGMSGVVREHGYWGSARDRLPRAQVDKLVGARGDVAQKTGTGARIRVPGRENLCLIRSGQDWSATSRQERKLYLEDIQPVLQAGMDFLRDEGGVIGCRSCRLMQVLDACTGAPLEKSFGLAHFDDLARLETWARSHPTHLAIFGRFMRYTQALDFQVALRLYHEVAVIPASAQWFEYINCHGQTGLLRG